MNFEDILQEAGSFGKFQILTLSLLCLPRFILPFHFLMHNFLAAIPPHRCAIPHQDQFANLTEEEVLIISIPRDFEGAFSSCEMFSEPQFHLLLNSTEVPSNTSSVQSCQYGWVYDQSQFTSTIATQVILLVSLQHSQRVKQLVKELSRYLYLFIWVPSKVLGSLFMLLGWFLNWSVLRIALKFSSRPHLSYMTVDLSL